MKWIAWMIGLVSASGFCFGALPVVATTDNTYPPEAVAAFMADCQTKLHPDLVIAAIATARALSIACKKPCPTSSFANCVQMKNRRS